MDVNERIAIELFGEDKPIKTHMPHINVIQEGVWVCHPDYWEGDECQWEPLRFNWDMRAAKMMELKILELRLQRDYIDALVKVLHNDGIIDVEDWHLVYASPINRVLAAIIILDDWAGEKNIAKMLLNECGYDIPIWCGLKPMEHWVGNACWAIKQKVVKVGGEEFCIDCDFYKD